MKSLLVTLFAVMTMLMSNAASAGSSWAGVETLVESTPYCFFLTPSQSEGDDNEVEEEEEEEPDCD